MKLSKKKGYDIYGAELSYAELLEIQAACQGQGNEISDGIAKTIEWYVANELPGPGETAKTNEPEEADVFAAAAAAADELAPDEDEEAPAAEDAEVNSEADEILPEA